MTTPIPEWLQRQLDRGSRGSNADLIVRAKAGERQARDLLVLHNLGLISFVTRRFRHRPDYEDVFAAGLMGLQEGIDWHDPAKGAFSMAAIVHIRKRVWRYLYTAGSSIAMGWGQEVQEAAALLRYATPGDGTPLGAVAAAMAPAQVSLDKPLGDDGEVTRQDLLESPIDIEGEAVRQESFSAARRVIQFALQGCPEREQQIIRDRWLTEPGATLETLGAQLQLTRERVRQLELMALGRMADRLGSRVQPKRILALLQETEQDEARQEETVRRTRWADKMDFHKALREQIEAIRKEHGLAKKSAGGGGSGDAPTPSAEVPAVPVVVSVESGVRPGSESPCLLPPIAPAPA